MLCTEYKQQQRTKRNENGVVLRGKEMLLGSSKDLKTHLKYKIKTTNYSTELMKTE